MIAYDLKCACSCQFEGWFACRADFDRQIERGLIFCPHCGSDEIHKILSPVPLHSNARPLETPAPKKEESDLTTQKAVQFFRSLQEYMEKNFEDVGPKLAEESLKIRYGIVEPRNIRGVTTTDEEKMLLGEGIELLKIPVLKKTSDPETN